MNILRELGLETVSETLPCSFVIVEAQPDYRLLYANDSFMQMLRYDNLPELKQALGDFALRYVVPEDVPILRHAAAAGAAKESELTFRLMRRDKTYTYVHQHARHSRLSDGTEVIVASYFDVDQYEQQAHLAEQKMRYALSNIHVAVWECLFEEKKNVYTPETVRDFCIPAVMEHVPDSLIASGEVHPDSVADLRALYHDVMHGAPSAEGEIAILHYGEVQWLKMRMKTIYTHGKPVSAICTAEDITREKMLLQKMENEISRRNTLESTLRGKGYYDLTDNRILEYDTSRLISMPVDGLEKYTDVLDAVSTQIPDEKERRDFRALMLPENLLRQFEKSNTDLHYEYHRHTPEGELSLVQTKILLARQPSTDHIVAFMYTTDITEARLSKQILDDITTEAYDYITVVDNVRGSYRMFSHSSSCGRLMPEIGSDYWTARNEFMRDRLSDAEFARTSGIRTRAYIEQCLSKEQACEFIYHIISADQAPQVKKLRYTYLDSIHRHLLVTCTDITAIMNEEKRQKEQLHDALVAAKQASSAKSNFLSRMSHEIRTPLNAILGMSTLALQSLGKDEEVADCVSKIGISGRYLLSLVNDILDMSRIESGKMLLRNVSFRFSEMIQGINAVIVRQANEKNVDYESLIDSEIDECLIGDAMKLQQIMVNLLSNAVKFTPEHGKVVFSAQLNARDGRFAKIRFNVNDTGCGIAESAQERIFEPFEQQDTSITAEYGGTGLGLAITKNLVELMGGLISLRSIVGVGTEFTVDIPLEMDPSRPIPQKRAYSFIHQRALVVDDDALVCEQTVKILHDIGMLPEWVTSGMDAIEQVRREWERGQHYDFILVDWKMPDMDGIETSRRIRKIVGPEVTIIIITAYDWAVIEKEARAAGVNMLINKPMFKSTLISAFEAAAGEAKNLAEQNATDDISFAGKRFLLVEDHPLNAEIASKLLVRKGAEIERARNGIQAMEQYAAHPAGYYDLILMDIRMPVMDGLSAARNIRHWSKEDARTIPIVAMTANAFEEDIEKSKEAGMNAHLAKPVDPELMYRVIYKLISL